MINKVYLMGRLAEDPELDLTSEGRPQAHLFVITTETRTEGGKKKERPEIHHALIFGRQAENSATQLRRGSEVLIDGYLHYEKGAVAIHANTIKFI